MNWRIDCLLWGPTFVNWIPFRLSSPQTTAPTASTATLETGSRNDNWTASVGFKPLTSASIPPWLRFQLTPRIVRESTMQITCARIGTRVYLRRFSNIRHPRQLHSWRTGPAGSMSDTGCCANYGPTRNEWSRIRSGQPTSCRQGRSRRWRSRHKAKPGRSTSYDTFKVRIV